MNNINYEGRESAMDKKVVKLSGMIKESLVNGPGMRRVFFAQGCKHNCEGCFNPETHNFQSGKEEDVQALVEDIKRNPLLRGVTFSGGDPLEQGETFGVIAEEVKKLHKDVWCYTGYTFEEIVKNQEKNGWHKLIENLDVLVDGKFDESKKDENLKFRGSSNQRIIDVQKSLKEKKVVEFTSY